jgi:hypothetical protein
MEAWFGCDLFLADLESTSSSSASDILARTASLVGRIKAFTWVIIPPSTYGTTSIPLTTFPLSHVSPNDISSKQRFPYTMFPLNDVYLNPNKDVSPNDVSPNIVSPKCRLG